MKLTTDRHEASRGLFATAELLVSVPFMTRGYGYAKIKYVSVRTHGIFRKNRMHVYVSYNANLIPEYTYPKRNEWKHEEVLQSVN